MSSFQYCCTSILTAGTNPLLGYNSYSCCNILLPPVYTGGGTSSTVVLPLSCTNVTCTSYSPVCFTPTSSNLCGYIQGIDQAICAIQTSIATPISVNCSTIAMTGLVNCCGTPLYYSANTPYNLCQWSLLVDQQICNLNKWYESTKGITVSCQQTGGGTGSPASRSIGAALRNQIIDGGQGIFSGTNTLTGITATGATLASDSSVVHGTSFNSLRATSTATGTAMVNTTTPLQVDGGSVYKLSAYVFIPSGSSLTTSSAASILTGGTGNTVTIKSTTLGAATHGSWKRIETLYYPDLSQTITPYIQVTNFTSGQILNFADLVLEPYTTTNSGANYEYELSQLDVARRAYQLIASPFAAVSSITNSGLYITLGSDTLVIGGKVINTYQQTLGLLPNITALVYYDTWTDTYGYKNSTDSTNLDSTQLSMYTITTNGSAITSTVTNVASAPYTGSNIQAASILGSNIALSTITNANLVNSGVTANTYGSATVVPVFIVNAQGIITSVTNTNISFPVSSVNGFTGVVSLGINDMDDSVITAPSNGQFLKYNGTNWINAAAPVGYYQTILTNTVSRVIQQPNLNFTTFFTVANDNANSCTTIDIAANGLTYDRIQQTSAGNVLIGNPTGSAGNVQEVTLNKSLVFNSGNIGINAVVDPQTGTSYNIPIVDVTGAGFVLMSNSSARTAVLPVASSVPAGFLVYVKDTSGTTSGITVSVSGGGNINGSTTFVISLAYQITGFFSDGNQWWN